MSESRPIYLDGGPFDGKLALGAGDVFIWKGDRRLGTLYRYENTQEEMDVPGQDNPVAHFRFAGLVR